MALLKHENSLLRVHRKITKSRLRFSKFRPFEYLKIWLCWSPKIAFESTREITKSRLRISKFRPFEYLKIGLCWSPKIAFESTREITKSRLRISKFRPFDNPKKCFVELETRNPKCRFMFLSVQESNFKNPGSTFSKSWP